MANILEQQGAAAPLAPLWTGPWESVFMYILKSVFTLFWLYCQKCIVSVFYNSQTIIPIYMKFGIQVHCIGVGVHVYFQAYSYFIFGQIAKNALLYMSLIC